MIFRRQSLFLILVLICSSCEKKSNSTFSVSPQTMTDALHAVMEADRTIYTQQVVNRLAKIEKVISASEHWDDEKALPLPAQMFRMGSERVQDISSTFSYSLLSKWPVNKQNMPKTKVEQEGLEYIEKNVGSNYYGTETLGGVKYYTAVYPDKAVSAACVDCHNDHKDSPRTDFKLGDVMGGVVIRVPLTANAH